MVVMCCGSTPCTVSAVCQACLESKSTDRDETEKKGSRRQDTLYSNLELSRKGNETNDWGGRLVGWFDGVGAVWA